MLVSLTLFAVAAAAPSPTVRWCEGQAWVVDRGRTALQCAGPDRVLDLFLAPDQVLELRSGRALLGGDTVEAKHRWTQPAESGPLVALRAGVAALFLEDAAEEPPVEPVEGTLVEPVALLAQEAPRAVAIEVRWPDQIPAHTWSTRWRCASARSWTPGTPETRAISGGMALRTELPPRARACAGLEVQWIQWSSGSGARGLSLRQLEGHTAAELKKRSAVGGVLETAFWTADRAVLDGLALQVTELDAGGPEWVSAQAGVAAAHVAALPRSEARTFIEEHDLGGTWPELARGVVAR